jgi:mannose-6-phosphate isomerase-like protein (cupin superfamily)
MPTLIERPARIPSGGNVPMVIDEYVGRVNTGHAQVSIAHLRSPAGWIEPGQTPEFDEYTLVLRGVLCVAHRGGTVRVGAGQAVITRRGEWIQYSSPEGEGAEYVAVCLPAFSLEGAHRAEL